MNGCPVERAGRVNFFVKYTVYNIFIKLFVLTVNQKNADCRTFRMYYRLDGGSYGGDQNSTLLLLYRIHGSSKITKINDYWSGNHSIESLEF